MDVYQVSYVPFVVAAARLRGRRRVGDRHLLPGHDLSVAPGGAARSGAGAAVRVMPCALRQRQRGLNKFYVVGTPAACTCCATSISTSQRARWWPSSARRASARARCCTCSAGSIAPTRGVDRRWPTRESAAMTDAALVEFRNRHVGFVFQFHHLLPEFDAVENVEMPMRIARHAAGRGAAPGARSCSTRVGLGERARRTGRACCRAASSSASPWRARW